MKAVKSKKSSSEAKKHEGVDFLVKVFYRSCSMTSKTQKNQSVLRYNLKLESSMSLKEIHKFTNNQTKRNYRGIG